MSRKKQETFGNRNRDGDPSLRVVALKVMGESQKILEATTNVISGTEWDTEDSKTVCYHKEYREEMI